MSRPPSFVDAAELFARSRGASVDAILEADERNLRDSTYPSPDCLQPDEVEGLLESEELPGERLNHIQGCRSCAALIDATQPSPEDDEAIIRELREWAFLFSHKDTEPVRRQSFGALRELTALLAARLTAIDTLAAALDVATQVEDAVSPSWFSRLRYCLRGPSRTVDLTPVYREASASLLLSMRRAHVLAPFDRQQISRLRGAVDVISSRGTPELRKDLEAAYEALRDDPPPPRSDEYSQVAGARS